MKVIFTIIILIPLFFSCKKTSVANHGLGTLYIQSEATSGGGVVVVRVSISGPNYAIKTVPDSIIVISSVPLYSGNILDTAIIEPNNIIGVSEISGTLQIDGSAKVINANCPGYTFTY